MQIIEFWEKFSGVFMSDKDIKNSFERLITTNVVIELIEEVQRLREDQEKYLKTKDVCKVFYKAGCVDGEIGQAFFKSDAELDNIFKIIADSKK